MIPLSVTKVYRRARNWAQRLNNTPRRRPIRRLQLETLEERCLLSGGTWTQLPTPPSAIGTMTVLGDGSILGQGAGETNQWYKLTPNAQGSYANGTWSSIANSNVARLYYGSALLPNGNLFVVGGEYASDKSFSNSAETYNPVTNKWTVDASFPQSIFGDDPVTTVDPNGKLLAGYVIGPQTYNYNPNTNTWTFAANKLRGERTDEEGFQKLPNGKILAYDVFNSVATGHGTAQIYDPATNTWSDASNGLSNLVLSSSAVGYELGPATVLPNGDLLQVGANNLTAIYHYQTNSWTAGPTLPSGTGADDAPGAMLPDGTFVFGVDTPLFNNPTHLYQYDYTTNSLTQMALPAAMQSQLNGIPSYTGDMVVTPSGQLLYSPNRFSNSGLWLYTPNDAPQDAWRSSITSVANNGGGHYTLTGTQLTGISEGSSYGDDNQSASNYPIIQLKDPNTGKIYYVHSHDWSSIGVSAVGDTTSETTKFDVPSGVPAGTYQLTVIANGIPSKPVTVNITNQTGPGNIVGRVFNDLDHSGVEKASDPGMGGWLVYLDLDHNGQFDPGVDPYQITDSTGHYAFTNLSPGAYTVGEVLLPNYVESTPPPQGQQTVIVAGGNTSADFGDYFTVPQVLIDDADQNNFSTTGGDWGPDARGFNGGSQTNPDANDPTQSAQWTVTTGKGSFELFSTWVNDPSFATNATYLIKDGNTLVGTVHANQQLPNTQAYVDNQYWNKLGTFTTTTGTFTIQLLDAGTDGGINADAVFAAQAPVTKATVAVIHVGTDETGSFGASNALTYLRGDSRFAAVDEINVDTSGVPTAAQLAKYNAVLVVTDNRDGTITGGGKGTQLGNVLDTYFHNGGRVILSAFDGDLGIGIDGAILNDSPATILGFNASAGSMNIPAGHPYPFAGVNSFSAVFASDIGLSAKGIDIANYASGTIGVATTTGNGVMFVNGFPFDQSDYANGTQFGLLFANALANAGPSELAADFSSISAGPISSVSTGEVGTPGGAALTASSIGFATQTTSAPANTGGVSNLSSAPTGATGVTSSSNASSVDNLFMSMGNGAMLTPSATPIASSNGNTPTITGAAFNSYLTSLSSTSDNNLDFISSDGGDGEASSQDQLL